MNQVQWKKGLLCGGLFVLLLGLTFYLLLAKQDPAHLWAALKQVKLPLLGVGACAMVVFFLCEAKNIQRGLYLFGSPAPYRSCLLYAVTGFFFSSVTPSASGGQPMQLYAMYRDGHSPAHGALALLLEFFSFQLAAVTLGVGGFLLHKSQLLAMPRGVLLCFLVGAVLNLVVVFLLAGAVISPRLLPALGRGLMVPARRFFPRRAPALEAWGKSQWQDMRQCIQCCKDHKKQLGTMFLTSLVQLLAYHSIPFWVFLAFGLSGQTLWSMIALQAVLFLSVSSLPLPGAVGLSEGGFLLLYQTVFPAAVLPGAMLLSRSVSFYLFLLLTGVFLAFRFLRLAWQAPLPSKTM